MSYIQHKVKMFELHDVRELFPMTIADYVNFGNDINF